MTFDDNVYLSLGPEAKWDIYNTFDPDKPFNIHLDLPSTEQPPLVKIKQEGKASLYTTDFHFTNKLKLERKLVEIQNHMHDSVTQNFDRVSGLNDNGSIPLQYRSSTSG